MRYVIWGISPVYSEKIDYIKKENIVTIVERKGRTVYRGIETIFPEELKNYEYDYIVIMSRSVFEIAREIIDMGIGAKKIIPAINIKPMLTFEAEYIADNVTVEVDDLGNLVWNFPDSSKMQIGSKKELELIRKRICDCKNADIITRLSTLPVGKLFGSNRGGSIVRYYIDEFMLNNQRYIKGRVLEIGDRHYTEKYGKNVYGPGYVLYYNRDVQESEFDFVGDLCDGTGIKDRTFDCVILTQVLMYLKDLNKISDVLINSLNKEGVLLISVSGIANTSHLDVDRYEYYWNFTESSVKQLFKRDNTECDIYSVGNCKTACAFLQGMSFTELSPNDLSYRDGDYPLLIFAVIKKLY